jgi:hypothetical protein
MEPVGTDRFGFKVLERVTAKAAWGREASDFTPWLAENLDRLGGALGLALSLRAVEHPVGRFYLDLLCEDARGRTVIVENQFERTDHDHLGKLLTYASGTEADVIVWVAESFTDEHLGAVAWLNDNTMPGVGFYAVRVEVLQIGSERAPNFEVMARPNEFVQSARSEAAVQAEWTWDAYADTLHIRPERLQAGRLLVEALERLVAESELPWQTRFRKGYVAIQRPGGYNVAVVDLNGSNPVRLAFKLPAPPSALGLVNPYPNLREQWNEDEREWGWGGLSGDDLPDVRPAFEIVRPMQPEAGALTTSATALVDGPGE